MRFPTIRVPLWLQMGVVVLLFAAAVVSLWLTGAEVVEREGKREGRRVELNQAGDALARAAADDLAQVPDFPYSFTTDEWDALDAQLAAISARILAAHRGVEGGYFVVSSVSRFVGHASSPASQPHAAKTADTSQPSGPPQRELYLIQNQVDAAIEKNQVLFVVVDLPPGSVAVRTAPIDLDGRIVGATWTMARLPEPLFLDRSAQGYQRSAGLALAGIVLALALTFGLARTVRHQAAERDRLQMELRRNERLAALGRLLAGVAHEVRNPLAGIRSTVQLWQRGLAPDSETAVDLDAEVNRLEAIISRLLQFSRAGVQSLAPGDVNAVVAEAARLVGPAAETQGVNVELTLEPALPCVEMAPPALLQVFRNLTTNALHAMPCGGTLRLETRSIPERRSVGVWVSDSGPGIDAESFKHIFEPFYTTKPEGTGLGLAIAREIALAHRGELTALPPSETARGARFCLILPAVTTAGVAKKAHQSAKLCKEIERQVGIAPKHDV
jgi:signal transduction histidine kinase